MKFDKAFIILAVALALSSVFISCKPDDKDDNLPTLGGNLRFSAPDFVKPGDVLQIKPTGAFHPEDGDFGYYWIARAVIEKTDTTRHYGDPKEVDGTVTVTIPDSVHTFSISCSMFAKGYSVMTAYDNITIVADRSISNLPAVEGEKLFVDERDGNEYSYVTIGGLDWMNDNLRYAAEGKPYADCEPMTNLMGNLYTWEEAENACPEGWRIPTEEEWQTLCGGSFDGAAGALMVDAYFNREKMWEYWPKVSITNDKGMNFIPSGYAQFSDESSSFEGMYEYATAWTSTPHDEQMKYISLYVSQPDVFVGAAHKDSFAASIRCVRDSSISE